MFNFNLISYNVRGIRNHKKRANIFHWLNSKNCNVCFLQEVHVCQKDIKIWEKEYDGTFYYSSGSNNSKGVVIGISNKLLDHVKMVKEIYADGDGRILGLALSLDEINYNLWNIYAPNDEYDRKLFFDNLNTIISTTVLMDTQYWEAILIQS